MDFYIYDNLTTLMKMHPYIDEDKDTLIPVHEIMLTPSNAFWFSTQWERKESNVNVNAPYVHVHNNNVNLSTAQFNGELYRNAKVKYNPKLKTIEIKKSWFRKPAWFKKVTGHYYGSMDPTKTIAVRTAFYNYTSNTMYLILDYYPAYNKPVKWDIIHDEEPATKAQIEYAAELERKIKSLES